MSIPLPIQGRGSAENPANRFERVDVVVDDTFDSPPDPDAPQTVFLKDTTRQIIAHNDSPDVGFEWSINPYRGCEHGCIYCYARPTHEWLGFSAGLDFETKIMVKTDAPTLLRESLLKKSWQPATISISGVTDCYQPVERKLLITRSCLEVLLDFRNPCGIVTKSHLVTRDIDILRELAAMDLVGVFVSITTLDENLARLMEPRAAAPKRRLDAIAQLSAAGIPVGVMVAPIIPGLTDHEMSSILHAAAEAAARSAGYTAVRLPYGVKDLFVAWLDRHFPDRKNKILSRITDIRAGKLNSSEFGDRMRGHGLFADQIHDLFMLAKRKAGLNRPFPSLSTAHFRRPDPTQPTLFS